MQLCISRIFAGYQSFSILTVFSPGYLLPKYVFLEKEKKSNLQDSNKGLATQCYTSLTFCDIAKSVILEISAMKVVLFLVLIFTVTIVHGQQHGNF